MKTKLLIYLCALACVCGACKNDKDNVRISPVQSISFDSETYSMNEGEKLYLSGELTIMPTAVADTATVTWRSSDESIATVSEYGTVSGIRSGEVEICAESNHKKATCTVTVNRIPVTKLMVPKKLRLPQNKWKEIPIVVEPENASLSSVRVNMYHDESGVYNAMQKVEYREGSWWMYSSSRSGVVYQLDVVSDDSGDSIHAVVEVYSILATKIEFTESTYKVGIGQTHPTELIYTPDSVSYKNVHYTSSDESIATVDENGVVTGVAEGMATITATSNGLETTCTAIVGNFVYKPVENLTTTLDHIWIFNTSSVSIPKSAFTIAPADATKQEISLSITGSAASYAEIERTTEGWKITPNSRMLAGYLTGELEAKADNKTVKIPFIVLSSTKFFERVANPYEKFVTAPMWGIAERIVLGQEIPKEFGEHMKLQLVSIDEYGAQGEPQSAFYDYNGPQLGTGQYIAGPVNAVVIYSYVQRNTEYDRYSGGGTDYHSTTVYKWRMILDGIYGNESKQYTYDYQQIYRSGFSHYKLTMSSPTKVYSVGTSQTTHSNYVTVYDRYHDAHFTLGMPNNHPDFSGDAGPITFTLQAFADHEETSSLLSFTTTFASGAELMNMVNEYISQNKELQLGVFGAPTGYCNRIGLKFNIWDRYNATTLEWSPMDASKNYNLPY